MLRTLIVSFALLFGLQAHAQEEVDCAVVYTLGRSAGLNGLDRLAFDTTKFFIEHCSEVDYAFRGFNVLGGALQGLDEPWEKKGPEYKEWLKGVLFLNTTDPRYYCSALNSLFFIFQDHAPNEIRDFNAIIAVIDYILESDKCLEDTSYYLHDRAYFRELQHRHWADTVRDSSATPLDTGAVTLEDIGLEWIRGVSNVAETPAQTRQSLGEVAVRTNPFRNENELTIEMLKDGYARIEIFDILGRNHFDDGNYLRYPEGSRTIRLPDDLPAGTLYLRVTTPLGEIRTLQLQKLN